MLKNFRMPLTVAAMLALALVLAGCAVNASNQANPAAQTSAAETAAPIETAAPTEAPAPTEAAAPAEAGALTIPLSELDGSARVYLQDLDGVSVEVIALKLGDGSIRTAFNACQVCYDSGKGYYKQEGDQLVCQNCGNRFRMDQVGVVSGGCNPVPIGDANRTVDETSITISRDVLKKGEALFQYRK